LQETAPLGRGLLDLDEQVLVIPIATSATEQRSDVAVDRLDDASMADDLRATESGEFQAGRALSAAP
jgi:hypothetical protein